MARAYHRLVKIAFVAACAVPPLTVYAGSRLEALEPTLVRPLLAIMLLLGAVLVVAVFRTINRYATTLESLANEQSRFLQHALPERHVDLAIVLCAAAGLFLELTMIRWQATVFEFFAFYKNFSLLSCFAGLGLGYALAGRRYLGLLWSIPLITLQVFLMLFTRYGLDGYNHVLRANTILERLTMGIDQAESAFQFVALYFFLAAIFVLTIAAMIPLGQACGLLMQRRKNLHAYGLNLLGSVVGVGLLSVLSLWWSPPTIWFIVAISGLLPFLVFDRRVLLGSAVSALVLLAILSWPTSTLWHKIYSPYQLLERGVDEAGITTIRAAGHWFQQLLDLGDDNANRRTDDFLRHTGSYYDFPYRMHDRPARVAVLGAGTGNDVAAALRMGAEAVDAVEIDPAILACGKAYHPERPYQDKRVNLFVEDARSFIRTTDQHYDMIVYGLLDSHALLSHASSVRLDSFVYTVEGLSEARGRLKPGGLISLSFCVLSPELGRKIFLMMEQAFGGQPPACVESYDGSVIFLQSKEGDFKLLLGAVFSAGFEDAGRIYADPTLQADPSTDDWPFLYMPQRVYPLSYVVILAVILLLFSLVLANFIKHKPAFDHALFFFLGAGFMLIETKGITELGLTFGNTWQVVSVAIISVLLMAFVGNCCVLWFRISNPLLSWCLLFATLVIGLWISRSGGIPPTPLGRVATAAVLFSPMLFSGILFSIHLRRADNVSSVMAINLLGAMFGGLLEYNAMYWGFQFLYVLAGGLYGLGLISALVRRPGLSTSLAPAL